MEKKIFKRLAVAFIILAGMLSACDLDVPNPNKLSKQKFWVSEDDAKSGTNAIYNMFYKPGTFSRWMWFRLDLTSDEGTSNSPWAELQNWTKFKYVNYNFWEGNGWHYRDFYEAIFRANQAIAYIPTIEGLSQERANLYLSQAYFLRGFYYYYAGLLWGSTTKSLVIYLEPSQPDDALEGHTGKEIYEQAISDLSKAIELGLPEVWPGEEKGRATKGAALAYRAKTYMMMHNYEAAKADLAWLVEGEGKKYYDLVADYSHNFRYDTENNVESVFEIQYSDVHKAPAGDGDFDVNPNLGQNRGQFFAPPGIGWTDGELRPWLLDEFKKEKDVNGNFDIRLKYTAFYNGMNDDFTDNNRVYNRNLNDRPWEWGDRVFFRKYSSHHFRDYDDYHNPTNIRLVRYADVLLMYAEAIAETGGTLSKAVAQVDRVRARVDMPPLATNHPEAVASKDAFLKRLQMERVLELATEGHRWADIKRWGLPDTPAGVAELISRDPDFENFEIGKHNVLPIPSDEVNNNPNIEQNPNY
ncbi:MAG: RagB/SusD family nutrient uptake outer membrane protein [Porphyromonas sp.]|nr:RagB/SusD family nutrient uptake outer membrane protein [Porphyromonas sp.]